MKSVEQHASDVRALLAVLPAETVPVADALGRVLAADVRTRWPLPLADCSSMDGYAVRTADLAAGEVSLPVTGDVPAGRLPTVAVLPGTAVRIMTGGVLPDGAEAVVPVEATDGGTRVVRVRGTTAAGAFVRRAGEDAPEGTVVLPAGAALGPAQLAAAVAAGAASLEVARRPRVLVVGTGSELVPAGQRPGPAQVPDSNSYGLVAGVRDAGGIPSRGGPVPDDPDALLAVLEGAADVDLVVTSGGVSVGAYDVVKALLAPRGIRFERVAMQPGMPQACGRWRPGGPAFVGLPGNPVSALVSFELFVRPLLRAAQGAAAPERPRLRVRVAEPLRSPAGKAQYVRVRLTAGDSGWVATPTGGAGSHLLTGLAAADALLVVPADVTEVAAGAELAALPLAGWGA